MMFRPAKSKTGPLWVGILIVFTGITTLVIAWLGISTLWGISTLSYELTPDRVEISYGINSASFERSAITDVYILESPRRARRIVGTSVPGFYQGRWSFEQTGPITLYATALTSVTVIETPERTWGITPLEAERFVQALVAGEVGQFPAVPTRATGSINAILALLFLVTVPLLGGSTYYVSRVGRKMAYELTDTELLIHGGFRPVRVPYSSISDVRIDSPGGLPFRAFGIGLVGLHWGRFAWRDAGPNLRMYATRLRPLVLIRAGDRTYGITPEDEQGFLAALQKRL